MTLPETISADYTLRPSELAETLAVLIEARQPCMVWGGPGCGKSQVANQTADRLGYHYMDIRGPLLDPVDLRGIPWRDEHGRTRWAPPAFLPPTHSAEQFLVNLDELPSSVPMVLVALFQFCLERRIGEYEAPPGAAIIACGTIDRPPRPDPGPSYADMAAGFLGSTSTASVCDNLASFGGAPDRDEPDPREIWDGEEALYALSQAISIMVAGVAIEGTRGHAN